VLRRRGLHLDSRSQSVIVGDMFPADLRARYGDSDDERASRADASAHAPPGTLSVTFARVCVMCGGVC
jgi:hypothetical protein